MKKITLISFILTLMLGITSAFSQSQGCSGEFKTFTIGGYGTNCHGNNPGCYRDANFAAAFPNGLTIGCGNNTLHFTSSSAIASYLPAGGPPSVLSGNIIDPTSSHGVLSSQLIALTLSIGFDANDPNFSPSSTSLGSLTIHSGTFAGMSLSDFLQLANNVIGGCSTQYSASAINEVASAINENFDNGNTDNGYVNCSRPPFDVNIQVGVNPDVCDNGNGLVTITIIGGTPGYTIKIYKNNVLISMINSNDPIVYLSSLGAGPFTVVVTDNAGHTANGGW